MKFSFFANKLWNNIIPWFGSKSTSTVEPNLIELLSNDEVLHNNSLRIILKEYQSQGRPIPSFLVNAIKHTPLFLDHWNACLGDEKGLWDSVWSLHNQGLWCNITKLTSKYSL